MSPKRSRRKRKSVDPAPPEPREPAKAVPPTWLKWIDEDNTGWIGILLGALAFLIPWILYVSTAMREPGIHGDYVKFALLGKIWGIPHPSGFPLYLMFDGVFSLLPIGTLTFRVALLSATCVAIASHLVYRIGRQLSFPPILAVLIALLAATGRSVWLQGVIPEVYALHLLLMIAPLWALLRWDATGDDRWMWVAVWLYVLSLANHLTALFALPGLLIFPLVRKPRVFLRGFTWIHVAGAIFVVLALYGYLLWRSMYEPLHNEGHIAGDFGRFWYHVSAKDYAEEWSRYDSAAKKAMWELFVELGKKALTSVGWFAAWAGIIAAVIRNWRRAIPLALVPAGLAYSNFLYHTTEPESFFAACFPYIALLVGSLVMLPIDFADRRTSTKTKRRTEPSIASVGIITIVSIVLFVAVLSQIGVNRKALDLSGPSPEYDRATRITVSIETPAVVFTSHYRHTMFIRYCLWGDEVRDDDRVFATQTWNASTAQQALVDGKHVYIYSESAGIAQRTFALRPVDTGSDQLELYELALLPPS